MFSTVTVWFTVLFKVSHYALSATEYGLSDCCKANKSVTAETFSVTVHFSANSETSNLQFFVQGFSIIDFDKC